MFLLKTAPLLAVSVISSFMVAYTSASLLRLEPSDASIWSDDKVSTEPSIRNNPKQIQRTSLGQFGSLDKRGNDLRLGLASFKNEGFLVPVQAAAEALGIFYTSIAISAHGPWANITPRIWIRMTIGTVMLLITATEGTTIPWDFVSWFALQMLGYTERGYTGMYTASYVNPTAGNTIWVSLYHCAIGPFTDLAAIGAPVKVASCLNAQAQPWFPRTPRR